MIDFNDTPWNVRLDASVDPVCVVFAPGWHQARGIAAEILNFPNFGRIHVSQFNEREMREYEMPRALPAWKAKALAEAQGNISKCRALLFGEEHPTRGVKCNTCGGTPHVSGLPCVCGGSGLQRDEIDGLRRAAFDAEEKLVLAERALWKTIDCIASGWRIEDRIGVMQEIARGLGGIYEMYDGFGGAFVGLRPRGKGQ